MCQINKTRLSCSLYFHLREVILQGDKSVTFDPKQSLSRFSLRDSYESNHSALFMIITIYLLE